MSLQREILRAVGNSARTEKQLRTDIGADGKKLGRALKALVKAGKLRQGKDGYRLSGAA